MAELRFAVWNTEWMNDLFQSGDGPAAFKSDNDNVRGPKATNTVAQRRRDLAGVLHELALDVAVIVEGPNRAAELQLFFDQDVEGSWSCR